MTKFRAYLERQQPLPVTELLPVAEGRSTLFVTIPCYDEPDLLRSLGSLVACDAPTSRVSVIVVVNASEKAPSAVLTQNRQTIREVISWWENQPKPFFQLRLIHAPALPAKWAGVGWARKIAMDAAIRSLDQSVLEEGILVAFDADSTVSSNYLTSIEAAFNSNPSYNFITLNFSHPVDDPTLSPSLREGIILYELYLRYLRNAMEWAGYPHAIHTVGSSFAVKATAYVKQGGMNRRQAGEDFHFLHKIVLLGNYGKVTDATVFPSCRISHRVPFGTGAALKKWEEGEQALYSTYSLQVFSTLQPLLSDPAFFFTENRETWGERIQQFDPRLQNYIAETATANRLNELKGNCAEIRIFTKRFYHEISAFWIIRYLNHCEETIGGKGNLEEEATKLLSELKFEIPQANSARELLGIYRRIDNSI